MCANTRKQTTSMNLRKPADHQLEQKAQQAHSMRNICLTLMQQVSDYDAPPPSTAPLLPPTPTRQPKLHHLAVTDPHRRAHVANRHTRCNYETLYIYFFFLKRASRFFVSTGLGSPVPLRRLASTGRPKFAHPGSPRDRCFGASSPRGVLSRRGWAF